MSDAVSLRTLLRKTDGTALAIQQAAGAMMKHYDKSPAVATVEWRNALHQARPDQHLPLLYVANEVLQNSKRNRGNKFLESFSPVLGQSLIFISQASPGAVVEKIRRTVKIWADRHVFSVRYVNELLKGLEPYRNAGVGASRKPASPAPAQAAVPGGFSPLATKPAPEAPPPPKTSSSSPKDDDEDFDQQMALEDDANDEDRQDDDDDDAASEGDLFGDSGDSLLMNIELDFDKAAASAAAGSNNKAANRKRRRGSTASTGSARRRSTLSTSSLMELWTQVSTLQQSYDHVQTMLSGITPEYLDEDSVTEQLDTLVGDELLEQYKKVIGYERRVVDQRIELHNIARKRRALELEAVRYLPWLENTLQQDQDDYEFCDKVLKQLETYKHVHGVAKAARNERLQEEARRQHEKEELERKKEEEAERKKFMESAMSKVTEAQPGMVWNKATGEYQYLETEESWRD